MTTHLKAGETSWNDVSRRLYPSMMTPLGRAGYILNAAERWRATSGDGYRVEIEAAEYVDMNMTVVARAGNAIRQMDSVAARKHKHITSCNAEYLRWKVLLNRYSQARCPV